MASAALIWLADRDKRLNFLTGETITSHVNGYNTFEFHSSKLSTNETRKQGRRDSWWRHQMETLSVLLVLCEGNPPVTGGSPHRGQWRGALMFSLICAWTNDWANNRDAGDLRRNCAHYDVTVMFLFMNRPSSQHVKPLSVVSMRPSVRSREQGWCLRVHVLWMLVIFQWDG